MPHLRIDYTANLDPQVCMGALCQALRVVLVGLRDEKQQPVFPLLGTRVLAYPAPHHSAGAGTPGDAFIYLNLLITPGRSAATVNAVGSALLAAVRNHVDQAGLAAPLGITLHIDEAGPVYEGRYRPSGPAGAA
jgi:5-carboxymethyl-2-hydroxymuconate isomerase